VAPLIRPRTPQRHGSGSHPARLRAASRSVAAPRCARRQGAGGSPVVRLKAREYAA